VVQYERGGVWVVVAHGAYDLDSIGRLTQALETAAAKHPRVIVDASGVTFADSTFRAGLRAVRAFTSERAGPPVGRGHPCAPVVSGASNV
jgi:anti-anti-sigma regulatory factor